MNATAPRAARPGPTRTLVPREHGAYGQLLLPLVTALALGRPNLPAALLAYAAVAAFVAHESLLVVIGQRGKRVAEGDGPRARRVLAILGLQAVLAGAAGAWLAPPIARAALLLPLALGSAVLALAARRLERTIAGEVLVGSALASCGLAVALAAGAPLGRAIAAFVTWVSAFAAATLAVQVVLVRARSRGARDPGPLHAALTLALFAAALASVRLLRVSGAVPVALLPMATLSVIVCLVRVDARRLRALGWTIAGSGAVTAALLVAFLR